MRAYDMREFVMRIYKKYLDLYRGYHMIVDTGIASAITVHNIGSAKATDVSISIEFPDEIQVMDITDVRKLKEPEGPEKPRDLREIAYERAHLTETAMLQTMPRLDRLGSMPINRFGLNALSLGNHTVFESLDISDNTVNIEIKNGIVHTKCDRFRDIYITPTEKGIFKAKVTLMCAEYEEPEETEITFSCE